MPVSTSLFGIVAVGVGVGDGGRQAMLPPPQATRHDRFVTPEEAHLRCEAVSWISHDFPGWLRVRLVDVNNTSWYFVDKVPVFTADNSRLEARLPAPVHILCSIVNRDDGALVVSTAPHGVEAEDGQCLFRVHPGQLDRYTV
ncbi:hypothetical protein [Micromonospora sp. LH3U1]|uniref:hypothetical protein n=1 Tax=Micromonospora sp. LH3U1 TaxID=3018339 RepID=UPI00234B8D32|nr:hypothetical protein [Micromonospora sp. LH3U1]WCN83172.1 hypothetical protein PCA76_09015 [Micromonospora sp. LH3U1]